MSVTRWWQMVAVLCAMAAVAMNAAEAQKDSAHCGLKCFRWKKCMSQLSGGESRPGQLGNTGQIVLNTCDPEECDCAEEEKRKKKASLEEAAVVKEEEEEEAVVAVKPKKDKTSLASSRSPLRTRLVQQKPVKVKEEAVEEEEEVAPTPAPVVSKAKSRRRNPSHLARASTTVESIDDDQVIVVTEDSEPIQVQGGGAFLLNSRNQLSPERRRLFRQRY